MNFFSAAAATTKKNNVRTEKNSREARERIWNKKSKGNDDDWTKKNITHQPSSQKSKKGKFTHTYIRTTLCNESHTYHKRRL